MNVDRVESVYLHLHALVSFDIKWLKGQTIPLRPPLEERIKNRFPSSRGRAPCRSTRR